MNSFCTFSAELHVAPREIHTFLDNIVGDPTKQHTLHATSDKLLVTNNPDEELVARVVANREDLIFGEAMPITPFDVFGNSTEATQVEPFDDTKDHGERLVITNLEFRMPELIVPKWKLFTMLAAEFEQRNPEEAIAADQLELLQWPEGTWRGMVSLAILGYEP